MLGQKESGQNNPLDMEWQLYGHKKFNIEFWERNLMQLPLTTSRRFGVTLIWKFGHYFLRVEVWWDWLKLRSVLAVLKYHISISYHFTVHVIEVTYISHGYLPHGLSEAEHLKSLQWYFRLVWGEASFSIHIFMFTCHDWTTWYIA